MTFLKRNWLSLLMAVVCLTLTVTVVNQNRKLAEQAEQIQNIWSQLRKDVSDIHHLKSDVAELETAAKLVAEFSVEPAGIDAERQILLADVALTLQQWAPDTSVVLHVFAGEERMEAFLTPEDGVCRGRIEVPLQNSEPLRVTASVTTGGLTTLENVGGGALGMFLPIRQSGGGWNGPWYRDGVMTCSDHHVSMEDRNYRGTEDVFEPEFRFYRNGELALTLPGTTAFEEAYGDGLGGRFWPDTANGGWSVPCEVGDTVTMFFRCKDKYGLGYEFYVSGWTAVEAAKAVDSVENAEYEGKELTLFW